MRKPNVELLIRVLVSVAIFVLLFRYFDVSTFSRSLTDLRLFPFLIALLCMPVGVLVRAVRWRIILADGGVAVSVADTFSLSLVGIALDILAPAGAGEFGKTYFGYRWLGVKEEMLGSVVIDKVIALLSLFLLGAVSSLVYGYMTFFFVSIGCTVVLVLLAAFPRVIPFRLLRSVINRIAGSMLRDEPILRSASLSLRTILLSILVSFGGWLLTFVQWYLVCEAFGSAVAFLHLLSVAPLLILARLFPLAISGLGTQEAAAAYLFGLAGVEPTIAVTVSLAMRIVNAVVPGAVGAAFVVRGRKKG